MLETINRHNYERFLIDFADGNLSPDQHALVVLFLEQNPDIAEEFEGMIQIKLEPTNQACKNIESLKKTIHQPLIINNENYEHYFIAYHEGDLSSEEKIQVDEFVALNPTLEKDFTLFQKVYFAASNNTLVIDKTSLKRIVLANGDIILEKDFYELCIAYHEGDLDAEYISIIDKTIKNSSLAATIFNSFANLQLTANQDVIYLNKSALKKKGLFVIGSFARIGVSVAAAVAFVMLYYFTGKIEVTKPQKVNNPIEITSTVQNENTILQNNIDSLSSNKEIDYSDKNNIASSNLPKTKKRQENHLETIESPKSFNKLENSSIDMELLAINIQEQFVNDVDTGYYLVIASNNNRLIERNLPSSIKTTIRKVTRIFIKEKEELKAESPRTHIMNMAQYALAGYNIMTESNYSISRLDATDNALNEQEKRK